MGNAFDLPQALWKANLELQQRIGRLIQDSGRDWVVLGTRAMGEGAAEFDSEWRELLGSGNWQALAALPVDAFWRQAEQRLGDGQAWLQVAANAQDHFADGLQQAVQDWQQQTAAAWQQATGGLKGFALPETAFPFADWQAAFAAAVRPGAPAPAASTPARKAPGPETAMKQAAKKPARKSAKTAAKTAAKKSRAAAKDTRRRDD